MVVLVVPKYTFHVLGHPKLLMLESWLMWSGSTCLFFSDNTYQAFFVLI